MVPRHLGGAQPRVGTLSNSSDPDQDPDQDPDPFLSEIFVGAIAIALFTCGEATQVNGW